MYRLFLLLNATALFADRIPVVAPPSATEVERTAASELVAHLAQTYPGEKFEVVNSAPKSGRAILLGTAKSFPELLRLVPSGGPVRPESFVVATADRNGAPVGIVLGADPRGVLYGVYGILEKLGWGLYLSYEAAPAPRRGPVDFAEWKLADAPLCADRIVFEWHNFLSSISTWEVADWRRWIQGAARMRYNSIMLHAYGNNPMFTFCYNGQHKPVGYLSDRSSWPPLSAARRRLTMPRPLTNAARPPRLAPRWASAIRKAFWRSTAGPFRTGRSAEANRAS